MIKNISFSNFYSFYEETFVSFEVSQKPSKSLYDVNLENNRLNKVVSVIGANGSGKTGLIRPFAFIGWFISNSYIELKPDDLIPYHPHSFYKDDNTTFSINFILAGIEYKYNLTLNKSQVLHESLYEKTSKLFSYIFIRERNSIEDEFEYKQKNFDFQAKIANKMKDNASIISAAFMNDSEDAKKFIDFFGKSFVFNVTLNGRENYSEQGLIDSAKYFKQNSKSLEQMIKIICELDLGLNSVELDEVEIKTPEGQLEKVYLPIGVHGEKDKQFKLPFFEESSGTKSLFVLLRRLLPVLQSGGLAIIDEIDNDLHPHMLPVILELFKFEHTNPKNAQIIFTCHTPEVLNILKKHQVYLVEKTDLHSEAWRLDEMSGIRVDDNLYAKYYAGALGATPNI
uniref:AAA family ATPase n=1 Tax=Aliarcobacter sp. TaxID=2321116 RepID=UPI0040475FB5